MNKYLEKIASLGSAAEGIKNFGRDFSKGWKRSSTTSKVGLAMSASGLGLGVANYKNGVESKHRNEARATIESQSLNELKGISEALKKRPKVTVNVKVPSQEKSAGLAEAGRDALHFAKKNPLTALGAVAGATDGAAQTTRKKNESMITAGLRGVRNTIVGGVGGAAVGSIVEHGYNKYVRK
jgi:hypothetical protein